MKRSIACAASCLCLVLSQHARADSTRGALVALVLRAGTPVGGAVIVLDPKASGDSIRAQADDKGIVVVGGLVPGRYVVRWQGRSWTLSILSSRITRLTLELSAGPYAQLPPLGRSSLDGGSLRVLPHGESYGSVLETIEPFAVTDRIDVAGIESGSLSRWGVRGASWTQNEVLLDGFDVTAPSGGLPLFYPDVEILQEMSVETTAAAGCSPGAQLVLITREPRASFSGSALFRYTGRTLQWSNLSPRDISFGVESRRLESFPSLRFELGGRGLYGAIDGFRLSARLPRFRGIERSRLVSVTGKLSRKRVSLLGVVQKMTWPSFGAGPGVAVEATADGKASHLLAQARGRFRWGEMALHAARARLQTSSDISQAPLFDLATKALERAPLWTGQRVQERIGGSLRRQWRLGTHWLSGRAELDWASEQIDGRIPGGAHQLTVDGQAHAVALPSGDGRTRARVSRLRFGAVDSLRLGRRLRLTPAVELDLSRSRGIRWSSLSASLAGALALSSSGRTQLEFSLARHPHTLTTRLARFGSDTGYSWTWRRWRDRDGNGLASEEEIGGILRRRGAVYTSIDSPLPRPYTEQILFGVERRFSRAVVRVSAYHRWDKRLLETVNIGIRPDSYRRFVVEDPGPDGQLGTADDSMLALFDQQAQFGEDRFVLTHPDGPEGSGGLSGFSQGIEFVLLVEGRQFTFSLSGRAYRDVGRASPGNGVDENDTGGPGPLFDDPNTLVNARGRLFFDRAFTGKLALAAQGPRRIQLGAVIRYWDGQPFARQILLPELRQGFTLVQAFPRGRLRFTYNMTVDLRIARRFPLGGGAVELAADVFNLLNQALETDENVRTGEAFRRVQAVQPGRTLRFEARWVF